MVGKETRKGTKLRQGNRHQPLAQQIEQDAALPSQKRSVKRRGKKEEDDEEMEGRGAIEKKLSKKIIGTAKAQLMEEEEDTQRVRSQPKFSKFDGTDDEGFSDGENEGDYEIEGLDEITEEDELEMQKWLNPTATKPITLADIILEKIKQSEQMNSMDENDQKKAFDEQMAKFDPKIQEVYTGVGQYLHKYKSGKIPKALKIVPNLADWEEILWMTNPEEWTPHAVRAVTRIFASNLKPALAEKFYRTIVVPHVMRDIQEHKKLNFHLYLSLKKALYKPAAFYKGILLPICESRDCTLRQAVIIASVLSKCTIPVLHSAAAIMKIAEMDYSGANSIFLRALLNKKYALPYPVIDTVVNHFVGFTNDRRDLPVLWFQAFLVFVQRYKSDLLPEQKQGLRDVLKVHPHSAFGDDIRRELDNSKSRGEAMQEASDLSTYMEE